MNDFMAELAEKYKDRKIIVAWPSAEHSDYRFTHSLIEFIVQNSPIFNLGLSNSISSRISVNRNECVKKARQLGGTDIFWLDADIKFPVSALVKLLAHDKDIVCATTRRRDDRGFPVGVPLSEKAEKLMQMKMVGFPCMLTKMSVFDKLEQPYFAEPPRKFLPEIDYAVDELIGEDEYFCHHARKAGFDIWCDMELSTEIGHVGSDVKYIESQYIQKLEAKVEEVL